MTDKDNDKDDNCKKLKDFLECSFCGKNQREVVKLIAGLGVYICDECIELCNDIMAEDAESDSDANVDYTETASTVPSAAAASDNPCPDLDDFETLNLH